MPIERRTKLLKEVVFGFVALILMVCLACLLINYFLFPNLSLNGGTYIRIPYGEHFDNFGCSASYLGDDISDSIEYDGEVDETVVGIYNLKCIVTRNNITLEKERKVEIVDDIAPNIVLNGESKIKLCPKDEYIEEGFTAEDNYDGDLTSSVKVKKGLNRIVYTVRDSSNNEKKVVRIIDNKDDIYPELKLEGQFVYNLELNRKYIEPGFTANDNCDLDLTNKVEVSGFVDSSKEGTYILTYSVSDSSGNVTKKDRVVNVKKNINKDDSFTGLIYLTFDGGPSRTITTKILDLLEEKKVHATFFITNKDEELNDIIKKISDTGNTIGLQSYSNSYKIVYSSIDDYFDDLEKLSNKVEQITGVKSYILRFLGGSSNTISQKYSKGIMSKLVKMVEEKGYHYFDWNIESYDDDKDKSSKDIYNSVINGLSKDKINVVLMHDYEENYRVIEALRDIIDYGLEHGYKFMAIDMSVPMVKHRVNN